MEYLKPSVNGSSFNVSNYNFQDTKISIKSAEVAYAKIDDANLDTTTLTAATAANTSALSTLDSAYTTSASDTSIDVITLKGKTAYMTPGSNITTISDKVALTGTLDTNTCDVGKVNNFIIGKGSGNVASITGTNNLIVGLSNSNGLVTASKCTSVGCSTSLKGYDFYQTAVGYNASTGASSTCVGAQAATTGTYNCLLGRLTAGGSGANNIAIGYNAGSSSSYFL